MNIHAELLCELRRNEILEVMTRIRLLKEAFENKTLWDKCLALLGKWMIFFGKKPRPRYLDTIQESFPATYRINLKR